MNKQDTVENKPHFLCEHILHGTYQGKLFSQSGLGENGERIIQPYRAQRIEEGAHCTQLIVFSLVDGVLYRYPVVNRLFDRIVLPTDLPKEYLREFEQLPAIRERSKI